MNVHKNARLTLRRREELVRRRKGRVVACGKLSTAAQRQLLEDAGEMRLHGRLGDPEPTRGLDIAEPIDNKVHDLLLSRAQSFADGQLSHPGD